MSLKATILMRFFRILSMLSPQTVQAVGAVIGWFFFWLPNRERRCAQVNIDLCFPELSPAEKRRLLKRSLTENAKTLVEMPAIWLGEPNSWLSLICREEGGEILEPLIKQGKGVILAGPHLGAWEVAGLRLAALGHSLTTLYRPPRYPALQEMMFNGRSRTGAKLVPTDASGIKALYQALKRGEMVAILPDQQPKTVRGGVFAPFFGEPALTMDLLSRLARKTGAPVVFTFMERLPGDEGFCHHWVESPEGIGDADPVIAATALNKGVEACVRRCPQQYQWTYKRFRAKPDGSSRSYS
jgi:KDO2-lipid IV(A) lauroyltransferase